MRRTFNLGVGFVFVVARDDAVARASASCAASARQPIALGRVVRVPQTAPFEERVEWPA